MSLIESMRRRMMLAGKHDVPRESFFDSELQVGRRLQASKIPSIQAIGQEHTLAAMSLSGEAGWPTSAFSEMRDVGDEQGGYRGRGVVARSRTSGEHPDAKD